MQRLEPPCRPRDPASKGAPVDVDARVRKHLRLAIKGKVPGKLRHNDMRDQRCGRHAAIHHPRPCRCLDDAGFAAPAGIFWPDRADHAQQCGHDVERLADVFANPVKREVATGAGRDLGPGDLFVPRQMPRQGAHVARCGTPVALP